MELNTNKWEFFDIEQLFDISGSPKREETDFSATGPYPLISAKTTDNGVLGFYNEFTESGGALTIETSCIGHCTYQKQNFSGHGHLAVLRPKFKMSDEIALFLVTILNKECELYNYGRKCTLELIRKRKIKLPICSTIDQNHAYSKSGYIPDWDFIKKYMRSLLKNRGENDSAVFNIFFMWKEED